MLRCFKEHTVLFLMISLIIANLTVDEATTTLPFISGGCLIINRAVQANYFMCDICIHLNTVGVCIICLHYTCIKSPHKRAREPHKYQLCRHSFNVCRAECISEDINMCGYFLPSLNSKMLQLYNILCNETQGPVYFASSIPPG